MAKKTAKRVVKKAAPAKKIVKAPPRTTAPAKAPPTRKAQIKTRPVVAKKPIGASAASSSAASASTPIPAATGGGSAAAYAQYLPIAQQTPASQIPVYRQNATLAYQNIVTALSSLGAYTSTLAKLPAPFSSTALAALPSIALATIYAAAQVDLSAPGTTKPLLKTASDLRGVLLSSATALVKAGVLPAASVTRIAKGSGYLDVAQDCVDLAELFTNNAAAVQGKTPVTSAQITQASTVGNQLLTVLKPKGTPTVARSTALPTAAARDALGALLTAQYEQQARRAGMWIWGGAVDAHVPPLASRAVAKKKAATPAAGSSSAAASTGATPAGAPATK